MRFDIVTLFPEMIEDVCGYSIIKRAIDSNVISVNTINPREYTLDKHKKVDDTPYGGGAGMVLMAQPFVDAYESIDKTLKSKTLLMSPQGETFNNDIARELAEEDQLIIICGHYEGFDERIREILKPREISLGDFVLTGGELPALSIVDCVTRKLDGALGKIESMEDDSFEDGLLEYPHYTKPREYRGLRVPEVLLGGNHSLIKQYRFEQQINRTKLKRYDLYEKWLNNNKL